MLRVGFLYPFQEVDRVVEAYFTLKICISVLIAAIVGAVLIVCAVKKVVEVIALACKKKSKKKG